MNELNNELRSQNGLTVQAPQRVLYERVNGQLVPIYEYGPELHGHPQTIYVDRPNSNPPPITQTKKSGGLHVLAAILAVIYVLWPIDLLPDFIPIIGWIDDFGAFCFGVVQVFKAIQSGNS